MPQGTSLSVSFSRTPLTLSLSGSLPQGISRSVSLPASLSGYLCQYLSVSATHGLPLSSSLKACDCLRLPATEAGGRRVASQPHRPLVSASHCSLAPQALFSTVRDSDTQRVGQRIATPQRYRDGQKCRQGCENVYRDTGSRPASLSNWSLASVAIFSTLKAHASSQTPESCCLARHPMTNKPYALLRFAALARPPLGPFRFSPGI